MKRLSLLIPMAALAVALLIVSIAAAQSGGGYHLAWNSIDNDGMMFSAGGDYSLGGTIGHANAGSLSGGGYTLNGEFWNDSMTTTTTRIYLPIVLR